MWRLYTSLVFTLILLSCSYGEFVDVFTTRPLTTVDLTISQDQEETGDSLRFTVFVKNNSKNDIYIVRDNFIGEFIRPGRGVCTWGIYVLYEDSIPMSNGIMSVLVSNLENDDYVMIEKGGEYIGDFNINFDKLFGVGTSGMYKKLNGRFTVQLFYRDCYLDHKDALKGVLRSNKVEVYYNNDKAATSK